MSGTNSPSNAVFTNGTGVILDANLNAFVQTAQVVATMRNFQGIVGMSATLAGTISPGDGGGGLFYWAAGTFTDDGVNTIVPNSSLGVGAWIRSPLPVNLASPGPIGNTTPNTGKFTTLTITTEIIAPDTSTWTTGGLVMASASPITPSQTAGIVGTTTANNANAGSVGEYITATAGPTSISTATPLSITSISLSPGDWDVYGYITFAPSVSSGFIAGCISTTNNGFVTPNLTLNFGSNSIISAANGVSVPVVRASISTTTTYYLVAQANFTSGTCTATAGIFARRVR
jgi:hypothetical protein